jgi:RNA-directed DNA polymerase
MSGYGGKLFTEDAKGRRPVKGNIVQAAAPRTQSRVGGLSDLPGVRKAAGEGKRTRLPALLHHVTVGLLRDSFCGLKREAAGSGALTWEECQKELEPRLTEL